MLRVVAAAAAVENLAQEYSHPDDRGKHHNQSQSIHNPYGENYTRELQQYNKVHAHTHEREEVRGESERERKKKAKAEGKRRKGKETETKSSVERGLERKDNKCRRKE